MKIRLGDYELEVSNVKNTVYDVSGDQATQDFFLDLCIWFSEAMDYNKEHGYNGCAAVLRDVWKDAQKVRDSLSK